MSEVKIVRLATGEELICEINKTETEGVWRFKDVAILIPTQANSLGLAPFMAYSDAPYDMEINEKFIMFIVEPVADLKSQWQKMFSKVITANNQKIIV